jgi:N-acyl-D-amino-acid deacylase
MNFQSTHSRLHFSIPMYALAILILLPLFFTLASCDRHTHDIIITNGVIYDGTGADPYSGGVAVRDGRITHVGELPGGLSAPEMIDAGGMAVAPGFINVLSWANVPLLHDGRSMSDIKQGVTLEVMGEGWSMGPLSEQMAREREQDQGDITYDVVWRTLGEYLEHLEERGVSTNVASFVGGTTVRIHVLGQEDRAPSPDELERMKALVREAMQEGAMGLGTALIYAPAWYADTDELIALASAAAEYGGVYATHLRSEGDRFLEAVEEMLRIAEEAGIAVHIHHLKAAGTENWYKIDEVIERVEQAQRDGLDVTANMYMYTAASTQLSAVVPPWAREGGRRAMIERFENPVMRAEIIREMERPDPDWENFFQMVASPDDITLVGFRSDGLQQFVGWSLAEVAELRGTAPSETVLDLITEDNSGISSVYHLMSEENVERQVQLPWMTFGSDGGSIATEGVFLNNNPHPRAYGNFARLLGHYVRDLGLVTLEDAIHRLTAFPARILGIDSDRGHLAEGYFADIVVFDPEEIRDHATYDDPHHYATGVHFVLVNGVTVLRNGEHTGAMPGRFVRGPGWSGHE